MYASASVERHPLQEGNIGVDETFHNAGWASDDW